MSLAPLAVLFAAATLPGIAAPAGAAPSAESIFAAMRAALQARSYPPEIAYGVSIEGYDGKAWAGRTYDSFAFPAKGEIRARTISHEEAAQPFTPHGSGFSVLGFGVGGGGAAPDALGVPRLTPTYAFGLVPAPHAATEVPLPAPSGELPTIGQTSAVAKIYDVTLVGIEDVLERPCWHLRLKPLGNPGRYRVRDVWVERSTAQLVRLSTDGNFTGKETGAGRWTVDYAQAPDGRWYLADETSDEAVTADDQSYGRMRVRFVDVRSDPREIYDVGISSETLQFLQEP